jgi:hypothetical protein
MRKLLTILNAMVRSGKPWNDSIHLEHVHTISTLDDQGEVYKGKKHQAKFIEPSEESAKPLESAKKTLDLVAATVHLPIVGPSIDAISLGREPDPGRAKSLRPSEHPRQPDEFWCSIRPGIFQCFEGRFFFNAPVPSG